MVSIKKRGLLCPTPSSALFGIAGMAYTVFVPYTVCTRKSSESLKWLTFFSICVQYMGRVGWGTTLVCTVLRRQTLLRRIYHMSFSYELKYSPILIINIFTIKST